MCATIVALASAGGGYAGWAGPPPKSVAIFVYPWYGTPALDRGWQHWGQQGHLPPSDLASAFFPRQGPYSSSDAQVVRRQLGEIADAGVDTIIVSWWGLGSAENARLPLWTAEAARAGLTVAIHLEPYSGRTPATLAADTTSLQRLGVRDFYVYDSVASPDTEWADALSGLAGDVRVFANTALVGKAKAGGFDGVYTYDVLIHDGGAFRRLCSQARKAGLACAPSVGPGFDASRATGLGTKRDRRNGATYDTMWRSAILAGADLVTITSFNEWHEGTQIEPASDAGTPYASYEHAYGLHGKAAETAYLTRTLHWAKLYRDGTPPVSATTRPVNRLG